MSHLITPEAGAPGPNLRFPLLWEIPKEGGGAHLQKEEKGGTSSQKDFTLSLSGFFLHLRGRMTFIRGAKCEEKEILTEMFPPPYLYTSVCDK